MDADRSPIIFFKETDPVRFSCGICTLCVLCGNSVCAGLMIGIRVGASTTNNNNNDNDGEEKNGRKERRKRERENRRIEENDTVCRDVKGNEGKASKQAK